MRNVRRRDETGQVAGIELLPFGLLVFVVGALFLAQLWAVFDAKSAADAAARAAVRTFVESTAARGADGAYADAADAGRRAIVSHGRDPGRAEITPLGRLDLERCSRVTIEVSYAVPIIELPLLAGFGDGITVRARHSELVDPFRDGLAGEVTCVG